MALLCLRAIYVVHNLNTVDVIERQFESHRFSWTNAMHLTGQTFILGPKSQQIEGFSTSTFSAFDVSN